MRPEHTLIGQLMRRRIRPLGLGAAASAVHQACEATVPLAIGLVISQAVDGGSAPAIALAMIGTLALFTVLSGAAGVAYWTLNATTQREAHDLRIRFVGRILAADEGRTAGENMSILVSDCSPWASVWAWP